MTTPRPQGAGAAGATNDGPGSPHGRPIVERHHATTGGPRIVERTGVASYRLVRRFVGFLPPRLAWTVLGWFTQLSYLLWPAKRRWANENFAHVLGLDPDDPAVRHLARAAFRNYARYLVELMRLPRMRLEDVAARVEPDGLEDLMQLWRESGALILVTAHIGNNEFVAAGSVHHRLPLNVLADDTTFPEMFEMLRREREAWGVRILPWRNLREVYSILRNGELLGLLVDWGYRSDGVPVRLFGTWTTLPAGPAILAAKTGAAILPITARRRGDDTFYVTHDDPIRVASTDPAEISRATQAIADALQRNIAAAPEQWYSFKPMWPSSEDERRALAQRTGLPRPGPADPERAG